MQVLHSPTLRASPLDPLHKPNNATKRCTLTAKLVFFLYATTSSTSSSARVVHGVFLWLTIEWLSVGGNKVFRFGFVGGGFCSSIDVDYDLLLLRYEGFDEDKVKDIKTKSET
ncbi:hypothetical protein E2542_SST08138 [Spatholobus suberectus]|nr:hypothetical protein E2542_SST08138 [Spatholobus suberectus]